MIKSVEDIMRDFGEGARAVIWFRWRDKRMGDGHVIVVECRKDGIVNFGDPQNRSRSAKKILQCAALDSIGILRIDNLDFTDVVKRCCMNRE